MHFFKTLFSKPFSLLLLTIFLAEAGSTMVTPLMPFLFFSPDSTFFMLDASHASRAISYGYATAAIRVGAFLASVLLGIAMDLWGRRWVLFISCFGLACSMGILALSIDRGTFALFIGGLFFCNLLYAGKQTVQAMVGDEQRSKIKLLRMSLLQSGIALGACFGPMLSGNLSHLFKEFSSPFWVAVGLAVLAAIVVVLGIRETMIPAKFPLKTPAKPGFLKTLKERKIQVLLLQLFLSQLSWGTYYEFSPLVAHLNFHFTPGMTGFFVGMIAFWLILGSAVILPLLRVWFSLDGMKGISVLLMLLGIGLAVFSASPLLFWVSAFFVAVGDVMIYALIVNELSDQLPSVYQGRMTGLLYVVITLTWSLTGVLGGYLTAYVHNGALEFSVLGVLVLSLYFVIRGCFKLNHAPNHSRSIDDES